MAKYLTKTFTETRYWQPVPDGGLHRWIEIPRTQTGEIPLDIQVREWVERTGCTIANPGQLGMHSQWLDAEMTVRCTMFGLTVLYTLPAQAELRYGESEPHQSQYGGGRDDSPEPGRANRPGYPLPPAESPATDSAPAND